MGDFQPRDSYKKNSYIKKGVLHASVAIIFIKKHIYIKRPPILVNKVNSMSTFTKPWLDLSVTSFFLPPISWPCESQLVMTANHDFPSKRNSKTREGVWMNLLKVDTYEARASKSITVPPRGCKHKTKPIRYWQIIFWADKIMHVPQ